MPAKSAGTVAFHLSPMNPKLSTHLPSRVNSALFAKHLIPGEPVVVVKIEGLGFTGDYDHQLEGRAFVFRHDVKAGGHTLRIPAHLWMQNKAKLAHELMARRTRLPMIALIEYSPAAPAAIPQTQSSTPSHEAAPLPKDIKEWTTDQILSASTDDIIAACLAAEPAGAIPQTQGGEAATHQTHALENEGSTPSPETIAPPLPETTPTTEPSGPIMYGEMPLHEAVSGILKEAGSAIRIKAMSHQLSVSEDDIRAALTDADSTAEIANAGWVRLKPQETPAD